MKRRDFIKGVGAGSVTTAGLLGGIQSASAAKTIKWKMVTSWPKNFPGLGTGANFLAKTINEMSGGRLKVKVYGANEIVPALEVFDVIKLPFFLNFSTFSNTCFLMSRRSITTSIIQS